MLTHTTTMLLSCSLLFLQACHALQYGPLMAPLVSRQRNSSSLFSFSRSWKVLGPFQIGTREATWGADPLEYVGGFRNLSFDPTATFRSSLPTKGIAKWNVTSAVQVSSSPTSANASLSVSYSNVDWDFLKVVYGWTAVQYQAWARGDLIVRGNKTQHIVLHTDAVLEFWINDTHYFGGDFYAFRKAPLVLHLEPGSHQIDLRLVRDVRAFGGILEPTIDIVLDVQQASGTLELARPGILLSDVVDDILASPLGSIYVRNSGVNDIEIFNILPSNSSRNPIGSHNNLSTVIVAGQTRSVAFNVSLPSYKASSVAYNVTYKTVNDTYQSTLQISQNLTYRSIYQPHKLTFLHPSGIVSYAMLRPPAKNATCDRSQKKLPILLGLHGAGLEADSPLVTSALNPVSDLCAWVLFPTGVTPWSGDDWHNWGFADVEAAIDSIPSWIHNVRWKGADVDTDRWIVSGHSNGGQGTWYAVTHRPDKVLAAIPVSGYASIQKYVPYELWQPADPRRTAIISASLNSYRHEMLIANAGGIPIQQQHGEIDDNVPAYHSRFLAQQLFLTGTNTSYNEVKGQNHWWQTVMTTPELVDFYYTQAKRQDALPKKLEEFTLIIGNAGDTGSKSGIYVVALQDPGQCGRIQVKGHTIRTSNVLSLDFSPTLWNQSVNIDGIQLNFPEAATTSTTATNVYKTKGIWAIKTIWSDGWLPRRQGRQLGSMNAILRSRGSFVIRHPGSGNTSHIALQVSRNLHQYFQADSLLVSSGTYALPSNLTGNVITLAIGSSLEGYAASVLPIQVTEAGVSVRDHYGQKQQYGATARGAAYLAPLPDNRLELILWGADDEGLRQAARIVPMLTGVGQPDFVVLGQSACWRGIEGVLAMGFFDSDWEVTASSVVESS